MDNNKPCYGCDKRVATSEYNCHSDCPEYLACSKANRERLDLISRKRDEDAMIYEVKVRGISKVAKKKRTKGFWKG